MDEPSDLELLARIAHGDQAAAQLLVERVQPLVVRIARAHHSRQLPVDDLVHEVLSTMFARLSAYTPRPGIPFAHWLSRLAVHACLDRLRAERRHAVVQPLDEPQRRWLEVLVVDGARPVDEAFAARELVHALLAELPPRDRLLLTLLDLEGRSLSEVAAMTGWSQLVIKVRAFRARRRLRTIAHTRYGEQVASSPARPGSGAQDPV